MQLGGRFWLGLLLGCIGAVVAASVLFLLFGWAWAAWGFLGSLLVLSAIAVGIAWIYDRRQQHRRRRLAA